MSTKKELVIDAMVRRSIVATLKREEFILESMREVYDVCSDNEELEQAKTSYLRIFNKILVGDEPV